MANEWVKVELYGANNDGNPRRYTIADGLAVSKGSTLELTDPRSVILSTGTSAVCAGIAAEDHLPSVGVTSIAVWTDGIFEATASGAITIGAPITFCESNNVKQSIVSASGAAIAGYCLETAANAEVVNVRLSL